MSWFFNTQPYTASNNIELCRVCFNHKCPNERSTTECYSNLHPLNNLKLMQIFANDYADTRKCTHIIQLGLKNCGLLYFSLCPRVTPIQVCKPTLKCHIDFGSKNVIYVHQYQQIFMLITLIHTGRNQCLFCPQINVPLLIPVQH